jgi:hypothetical protein
MMNPVDRTFTYHSPSPAPQIQSPLAGEFFGQGPQREKRPETRWRWRPAVLISPEEETRREKQKRIKVKERRGEERRSGLLSGAGNGSFSFPFPFFLGLRMSLHLARSFSLSYVKGDTKMNLNLFYGIERYRIQPSIYAVDRGRAERERESSGLPPALLPSIRVES